MRRVTNLVILGALVMRGAMIAVGAQLIQRFTWIIYVFAVFLIATGVKMLLLRTNEMDPNRNFVVRLTRRLFPVSQRFHGHFFVRAVLILAVGVVASLVASRREEASAKGGDPGLLGQGE